MCRIFDVAICNIKSETTQAPNTSMTKKTKFPPGWDEERVRRVIKHSCCTQDAPPLTHEQRAELARRLREYEKSPDAGSPWPEVKERILKGS